jgi:hypothetical protein
VHVCSPACIAARQAYTHQLLLYDQCSSRTPYQLAGSPHLLPLWYCCTQTDRGTSCAWAASAYLQHLVLLAATALHVQEECCTCDDGRITILHRCMLVHHVTHKWPLNIVGLILNVSNLSLMSAVLSNIMHWLSCMRCLHTTHSATCCRCLRGAVVCRHVSYCSKHCQQADWSSHKCMCKAIKKDINARHSKIKNAFMARSFLRNALQARPDTHMMQALSTCAATANSISSDRCTC